MDDDAGQQAKYPLTSASLSPQGERPGILDDLTEQPLSPNDERIGSTNPSLDTTAITRPPRLLTDELDTLDSSGATSSVFPLGVYSPSDQSLYFGASGYDNSTGNWGEYSNYVNANNLQIVPPAMYNDSQSLLFHSGYGFDNQMPYGQFSPMANPLSPVMFDGQLYSPHQIPSYYPNNVSSALPTPISQTGMMTAGGSSGHDNNSRVLGQEGSGGGGGYYVHFGSFDGGNNPPRNSSSSLGFYKFPGELGSGEPFSNPSEMGNYLSPYQQPVGVLGSYEHAIEQQQTPFHGFGMVSSSSTRSFPHRNSNYGTGSISQWQSNRHNQFNFNKGGKRLWERDIMGISTVPSHGISNRGPRASKPKGSKNTSEEENSKKGSSGFILDLYNRPDFVTDYEKAKFFVIKSFSEDNVHRSVKYNVWASTSLGNRKLDAAYHEAKETSGNCPVFLFFSVNASGQFCGVAEMVGSVDFENDADYWQQDRWSGQFPVKWHILKDVPNSRFRHILLENNDNKPVTHSRDSQEVKLEHGIEMLKIFKEHDADTCIFDDFNFYDEREKALLQQKKATSSTTLPPLSDPSALNALSRDLADALRLEDSDGVHKTG